MSGESSNVGSVPSIASSSTTEHCANCSSPQPSEVISPKRQPSTPGETPRSIVYDSGPCSKCNLPLQTATEIISYIGMVFAIILIVSGSSVFAEEPKIVDQSLIVYDPKAKAKDTESLTNALEYGSVINLCRGFYDLVLYPMLWMGTILRNRPICLVFIIAKLVFFWILLIGTGFVLLLFGHAYIPMCPLILLIPEFYFLWVALCFTEELKVVGVTGGQPRTKEPEDGIFAADMFTTGIYGPGTHTSQHAFPDFANRGRGEAGSVHDFTTASTVDVKSASVESVGGGGGFLGFCATPHVPHSSSATPQTPVQPPQEPETKK